MPNPYGVSDKVFDSIAGTVTTPCYGMAMKRTKQGHAVVRLHVSADENMTLERLAEIKGTFPTDAMYRQEVDMDAWAQAGSLVYDQFSPDLHVIDDCDIPKRLTRYMVLDPHPRTPFYAMWVGIDRYDDWYVYRELWPAAEYGETRRSKYAQDDPQYTVREYAEIYALMEGNALKIVDEGGNNERGYYVQKQGGERICTRLCDQAAKGFKISAEGTPIETIASRFEDYGFGFSDPYKIIEAGEEAIRALLKPRIFQGRLWPKLHLARSCKEAIWEFLNLRYAPQRQNLDIKELTQKAVEARRHSLDALRYASCSDFIYIENWVS